MQKTQIRILAGTLVLTTLAQVAPAQARNQNERGGTIVGGIVGAIVGNAVSGRRDRALGTVIGAIAGAAIGNVVGQEMDEQDRLAMRKAQEEALRGDLNRPVRWDGRTHGSRSAYNGEFRVIREGRHRNRSTVCREYVSVIYTTDGRREETRGVTCQDAYGSWSEVQTTDVSWVQVERPVIVVREERPQPRYERPRQERESVCRPRYPYALQDLAQMDRDLQYWSSEMQRAAYGSSSYRYAEQELRNRGEAMKSLAADTERFALMRFQDLEDATVKYNDKMNSAAYGSVAYRAYGEISSSLAKAMEQSLQRQMGCLAYSSEELLSLAQDFDRKQSSSAYGSRLYNAYKNLASESYSTARQAARDELQSLGSFQVAERMGIRFSDMMASSAYGSSLYNSTKEMSQLSMNRAEELFRGDVRYMGGREKYELIKSYEAKMNSSSYGSMIYNHYRNMKSILDSAR